MNKESYTVGDPYPGVEDVEPVIGNTVGPPLPRKRIP